MIHLANNDLIERWIVFHRHYFGKRFIYKGRILSKWEAFGMIERNEISEYQLQTISTDYHKKFITVQKIVRND